MCIVVTRVHHADRLATRALGSHCGFEWNVSLFGVWQRVEFGSQCDGRTGLGPAQHGHHARLASRCMDLEAQRPRSCSDVSAGLKFAVRKLGVLVEVAAIRYHPIEALRCQGIRARVQRVLIIDGIEGGGRLWQGTASLNVLRTLSVSYSHRRKRAVHHCAHDCLHGLCPL